MLDRADGISLRSGFLRHAHKHPDAPAVVVRGEVRSYGHLERTARKWAKAIIEACGHRPERIGLFAYRSATAYAGTLAALFSGAAYVPLNPTYPAERLAGMISSASLDAIIIDSACMPHLAKLLSVVAGQVLIFPEADAINLLGLEARVICAAELELTAPLDQLPALTPDDVAYLLFTSGSTGTPKGVSVTHGNASYFMEVMSQRYEIRPEDRFSQTFDQTFDLSVFDLFMAWNNGACVYAMSPVDLLAPTKFINNNEISVWFSVPSVPVQMCRRNTLTANSFPGLRWSLFCGEPLLQQSAEMWQRAAPNSTVENLYGPTELTIACFVHRWDPESSPPICRNGIVPIGRPYPGLAALVVDEQMNSVADGEAGELCVNGPQTTPGYWRAPEITAQRYVNLPISEYQTRRFYRTGDLVMKLADGNYVFLGRADHQIKVLGHRVELGEIEAVLRGHPGVEHVVALGWPVESASAEAIVVFVSGNLLETDSLLAVAKVELPPYIVPRHIYVLSEMPLNANGKVDRGRLKEILLADTSDQTGAKLPVGPGSRSE